MFVDFDFGRNEIASLPLSQFEIKTVCRLMSNCGRLRIILFLTNSNEIFDFEMHRTNSSFQKVFASLVSDHLDI